MINPIFFYSYLILVFCCGFYIMDVHNELSFRETQVLYKLNANTGEIESYNNTILIFNSTSVEKSIFKFLCSLSNNCLNSYYNFMSIIVAVSFLLIVIFIFNTDQKYLPDF